MPKKPQKRAARPSLEERLRALDAVRDAPQSDREQALSRALGQKENFLIARAAELIGGLEIESLYPKLEEAFVNGDEEKGRYRVPWAKLLAQVYDVDSQVCVTCGEKLKPIGAVTDWTDARKKLEAGILLLGWTPMARDPPKAA